MHHVSSEQYKINDDDDDDDDNGELKQYYID